MDIPELLADAQTSFSGQAEAAGLELTVEVAGEPAELQVSGDRGRLDQVLSNLLGNAVRHTGPGGRIVMRAGPLPGDGVSIQVSDSGAGITPEELPFIFDRFWRGDRARTHGKGAGSGLGLAIARQLVHAHGGRITATSRLGEGTTFTIELPRTSS